MARLSFARVKFHAHQAASNLIKQTERGQKIAATPYFEMIRCACARFVPTPLSYWARKTICLT